MEIDLYEMGVFANKYKLFYKEYNKQLNSILSGANATISPIKRMYPEYQVTSQIRSIEKQISNIMNYRTKIMSSLEQTSNGLNNVCISYKEDENQCENVISKVKINEKNISNPTISSPRFKGQTIGPIPEDTEFISIEEDDDGYDFNNFLYDFGNFGNAIGGTGAGLKGIADWAKPFLEAGFKIKKVGEYYKIIFGSNQIKKLLGFRHKYPIADLSKSEALQKALAFEKQLTWGKIAQNIGKVGSALAWAGVILDAAGGLVENMEKDASVSETVGDLTVDTATSIGGLCAAGAAAEGGASAGAAFGTFIFPGFGTIIGGVAGGIIGGVGVGILYGEVISGDCFGLLPEGESIEQWLKDGATWAGDRIGEGINAAGEVIGKGINVAGEVIGEGINAAGKGINVAGEVIGEGINAAGKGINAAGDAIGDAIDGIGNWWGNTSFGW